MQAQQKISPLTLHKRHSTEKASLLCMHKSFELFAGGNFIPLFTHDAGFQRSTQFPMSPIIKIE